MLGPQSYVASFFSLSLKEWLEENVKVRAGDGQGIGWAEQFALIVWSLWGWRNTEIFEGERLPVEIKSRLLARRFEEAELVEVQRRKFFFLVDTKKEVKRRCGRLRGEIQWVL